MTMIQHKNIFMFKYKYVFMLKYKKINIDLCFYVLYTYFRGNTKKKPPIAVTIRGWHITYIPARSTNHAA